MESIEERLFALRDAARKHRVPVDGLPALLAETQAQLQRIDAGASDTEATGREVEQRRRAYLTAAAELSRGRASAAEDLAKATHAGFALAVVIISLLIDMVNALIDPRVRY